MNASIGFIVPCSPNLTQTMMPLSLRVLGGTSFLLLGVLSLLANGTLLLLLCKHHNLRSPAGWIMFNMAASDSLTAISAVVFVVPVVSLSCFPFDKLLLKIYTLLTLACYVQSGISIMFVSTDRYFAVCRPLHYVRLVTKNKVFVAEIVSWCSSVVYAATFLLSETGEGGVLDNLTYTSVVFYVYIVVPWMFPLFTIIFYCLMLKHVRRRRKVSCTPSTFGDLPQYRPQVKLAITMAIVTGIFLISNLPIVCVGAAAGPGDQRNSVYFARGVAGFLFYTSCLLNPVVYVSTFRPIREAGRKLLCKSTSAEESSQFEPEPRSRRRNVFYMASSPRNLNFSEMS